MRAFPEGGKAPPVLFGTGETIGDAQFIDGGVAGGTVTALEGVDLFVIRSEKLADALAGHPEAGYELYRAIARSLAGRLRRAVGMLDVRHGTQRPILNGEWRLARTRGSSQRPGFRPVGFRTEPRHEVRGGVGVVHQQGKIPCYFPFERRPVSGSRNSLLGPPSSACRSKANRLFSDPALLSNEKFPMRAVCQLSSMNRKMLL